jgi:hypothetical protein
VDSAAFRCTSEKPGSWKAVPCCTWCAGTEKEMSSGGRSHLKKVWVLLKDAEKGTMKMRNKNGK